MRTLSLGAFLLCAALTGGCTSGSASADGGGSSGASARAPEGGTRTASDAGASSGASGAQDTASPKGEDGMFGKKRISKSGHDITRLAAARVEELAKKLSPEDAYILLRKGTERPFCGTLLDNKKKGVYLCKICELPLFRSDAKFNSGTGWPSFFQPYDKEHVREDRDTSHGMVRVEILCERCSGHLGHVFEDGPPPTGLRYCLNSGSLDFVEEGAELPAGAKPAAK